MSAAPSLLPSARTVEQRIAAVVPHEQGDGVVFAGHHRPAQGTRQVYRVTMRHGVSTVRSGRRYTVGIIFHDAR